MSLSETPLDVTWSPNSDLVKFRKWTAAIAGPDEGLKLFRPEQA